jgi:protein-disulfide isomerase
MTQQEIPRLAVPVHPGDHVRGPLDAPVELVEYADFECPYCRAAVDIVREVQRYLGDRLCFAFRHFPLSRIHPHAERAAEAAEAAAAQGRFWEMHDLLFQRQSDLEDADLARYAGDLGLDVERFRADLAAGTYAGRVEEDVQSGTRSGADGTPTFYLDGLRYDRQVGVQQMLQAIDLAHPGLLSDRDLAEAATRLRIPRVLWASERSREEG